MTTLREALLRVFDGQVCRKRTYETLDVAGRVRDRMVRRGHVTGDCSAFVPYVCQQCGCVHLGHAPSRGALARRNGQEEGQ